MPGGIGGEQLAAPQAGLMAQLATGIVGGEMPWGLIIIGMGMAFGLILIKAPAPMLIAVGMYLPVETTAANSDAEQLASSEPAAVDPGPHYGSRTVQRRARTAVRMEQVAAVSETHVMDDVDAQRFGDGGGLVGELYVARSLQSDS